VAGETLLWDDHRGTLRTMRSKEESHDYRYFPDPDLPPLVLSRERTEAARAALPELPRVRRARLEAAYGLSTYDAGVLTRTLEGAEYFEAVAAASGDAKQAANWVMGPLQALLNQRGTTAAALGIGPEGLAELVGLVRDGVVSDSVAKRVLESMADGEGGAREIVEAQGLEQVRDAGAVEAWVDEVLGDFEEEAERVRAGEDRLVGFLVGQVMRRSGGKADPRQVNELVRSRLG
jgi:aspartyl-tRNA(Asn)/glutamyl-tRNA(Gln) amidotransferase subunit B